MLTDFFILHENDALLYFGNGITVNNHTGAIDLLSVGSRRPSEPPKKFCHFRQRGKEQHVVREGGLECKEKDNKIEARMMNGPTAKSRTRVTRSDNCT